MNIFVIVNMVAEFVDSSGIFTHYRVDPVNLLGQVGSIGNFELLCQIIYVFFVIFFIVKVRRAKNIVQLIRNGT